MLIRAAEGYCPCCDQSTVFVANNYWLRDYYRCIKCNSIPRNRAIMKVLHERFPSFKDLRVHESSPDITTISVLGVKIPNYSYSYYHDEFPLGADLENGGTNENLEQLTLPDNSVDVFITQDVMEHICNPRAAFQEIERVLCAGGGYMCSQLRSIYSERHKREESLSRASGSICCRQFTMGTQLVKKDHWLRMTGEMISPSLSIPAQTIPILKLSNFHRLRRTMKWDWKQISCKLLCRKRRNEVCKIRL